MKINIERVIATCFMSYDNFEYVIKDKSTTQILGKNGQGKSATYEAVFWCFYGDTARGIAEKKRIEVIKRGNQTCTVTVYGTVESKQGKSSFMVTRYDGKQVKLDTVIDGNSYCTKNMNIDQLTVNKLLGMDKNQFLSVTLLGHNSFDFNSVGDSEMKKVLNKYIDSEKYLNAQSFASTSLRTCQDEITVLAGKKYGIENSINTLKQNIEIINKRNVEKNKKEIAELCKKEYKLKRRQLDLAHVEHPDLAEQSVLQGRYETSISVIAMYKQKLKNVLELDNECSVCGNKISKQAKDSLVKSIKVMIKKQKNECLKYTKQLQQISVLVELDDERDTVKNDLLEIKNEIKRLSSDNDVSDKGTEKTVSSLMKDIQKIEEQIGEYEKKAEVYNFWSKGFGNAGIIGYLVDGIINRLNSKLSDISVELTNGSVIVQYSPYSTSQKGNVREVINKICFIGGEETTYANMSNSEKQRTKLLTLFAFRELSEEETGIKINMLYFDEVFEGLDEENSALVVKYTNTLKERAITILSHSPLVKYRTNRIFHVINNQLIKG